MEKEDIFPANNYLHVTLGLEDTEEKLKQLVDEVILVLLTVNYCSQMLPED